MDPRAYLQRRRDAAARAWQLNHEIVLIAAGDPLPKPGGADQTYPFLPHSEYLYLADRRRPGGVLAFEPHEGWIDFVPAVTQAERVWEGATAAPEGTVPLSELPAWLAAHPYRSVAVLGCPLRGVREDDPLRDRLREQLLELRRPKDDVELERMRRAAQATAAGYALLPSLLEDGRTERDVQIELEAAFFRAGADRTAYGSIVGSGPNSAVLHCEPSARRMSRGELVLVDAGGEVEGYACDVTRTYPVGGRFTPEQRDLYAIVLTAQERAVAGCRAGVEFRELHLAAARDLAEGLVAFGLLRGSADEIVATGAIAILYPHGLGHLVGLGVRDASGYLPGRQRSKDPVLQYLQLDLPLAPGMVTAIEPGLYIIPALIEDRELRERHRERVDWARADALAGAGFGGIRIEDNVLVTDAEPEVLTAAIPKAPSAISG